MKFMTLFFSCDKVQHGFYNSKSVLTCSKALKEHIPSNLFLWQIFIIDIIKKIKLFPKIQMNYNLQVQQKTIIKLTIWYDRWPIRGVWEGISLPQKLEIIWKCSSQMERFGALFESCKHLTACVMRHFLNCGKGWSKSWEPGPLV